MEKNRKEDLFIVVLYSIITIMLIYIGFIYTLSYVGAGISALVAFTFFQGDKATVKYAALKEGFKIRKDAKNGK